MFSNGVWNGLECVSVHHKPFIETKTRDIAQSHLVTMRRCNSVKSFNEHLVTMRRCNSVKSFNEHLVTMRRCNSVSEEWLFVATLRLFMFKEGVWNSLQCHIVLCITRNRMKIVEWNYIDKFIYFSIVNGGGGGWVGSINQGGLGGGGWGVIATVGQLRDCAVLMSKLSKFFYCWFFWIRIAYELWIRT